MLPYAQLCCPWGRNGHSPMAAGGGVGSFTYDAGVRNLWSPEEVTRERPANSVIQLSAQNMFYTEPPPRGTKLRATDLFVDTSQPVVVQESIIVEDFRNSKWISVRIMLEDTSLWTSVVHEPNMPRSYRIHRHYTNRHTQWGMRLEVAPPERGTAAGISQPDPTDAVQDGRRGSRSGSRSRGRSRSGTAAAAAAAAARRLLLRRVRQEQEKVNIGPSRAAVPKMDQAAAVASDKVIET